MIFEDMFPSDVTSRKGTECIWEKKTQTSSKVNNYT